MDHRSAFVAGFFDEFEKIAKKRKKKIPVRPVIGHAAYGAGLGGLATLMSSPFVYLALRRGKGYAEPSALKKMLLGAKPGYASALGHKEALIRTLLRIGERAAYGIPLGASGGWMGYHFFGKKKKKKKS